MAFLVDHAYLPATLTVGPMTDEQFAEFCAEHPDLWFEMSADGELIVMPPNFTLTGARNNRIGAQLLVWADLDGRGISCDSSAGFVLPSGARRSPDAAWISHKRASSLSEESFNHYWRVSPDFVIELRSSTDRLRVLRNKMTEWIANGTQLGWLIDPETRCVEIYRPGREVEMLTNPIQVEGEAPIDGFVLQLASIWDPMPLR